MCVNVYTVEVYHTWFSKKMAMGKAAIYYVVLHVHIYIHVLHMLACSHMFVYTYTPLKHVATHIATH